MNGVKTLLLDPSYPTKDISCQGGISGQVKFIVCSAEASLSSTLAGHYVLWEYLTKGV